MGDEIKAMGEINGALSALEADEVTRVLRWAVDKFGSGDVSHRDSHSGGGDNGPKGEGKDHGEGQDTASASFERISDLMDAANPATGNDYVLLGSYWFQVVESNESITGQQVNSALKDLGHPAANITVAFNQLKSRKLAHQIQKTGSSKQARKLYRLTNEGIKTVERMLAGKSQD